MVSVLQVITLLFVSLAMATAVGHALEMPGKMRLSKDTYISVQPMYYPGFTIVGGFGEVLGISAALGLLFLTPKSTVAFRLTLAAFLALVVMHVVFWVFTQPVNRFWMRQQPLGKTGSAFFRQQNTEVSQELDFESARSRWEYSHLARGVLSLAAVVLLASAIAASCGRNSGG